MTKIYAHSKLFLFFLMVVSFSLSAKANIYPFSLTYSGANENPPNASTATGTLIGTYNDVTKRIFYTISFSGLSANASGAHFHAPAAPGANAPIIIPFANFPASTSGTYSGSNVLTATQEAQLFAGLWYANIHTSTFPGGEIRTQVILGPASTTILSFDRVYSGANEVPANASTATGTISGTYDPATNRILFAISFSGLTAPASAAHFHGNATPGINAPVLVGYTGFPNATSGSYFGTSVLTDAQETGLLAGLWYSNMHNSVFPGGEIRTQIFFNEIAAPTSISCAPLGITVGNDAGACSASVSFSATAAGTPTPALFYRLSATANSPITSPRVFPVGTTNITATAINGGGFLTCTFNVVVNDTEAPAINGLAASPDKLWSPNHKMKDIAVSYTTTDNCPGPITCSLSVTSNENVNAKGDGNTASDWVVMDAHNVQLRAERSGKGSNRVYTITTTCRDQYGNMRQSTTTVTVPHDASARMATGENDAANIAGLRLGVISNPGRSHFTLNIQTDNNTDKITVRVFDLNGRMLESKSGLQGSQVVILGSGLKTGFYIVELIQGKEKRQLKVMKSR